MNCFVIKVFLHLCLLVGITRSHILFEMGDTEKLENTNGEIFEKGISILQTCASEVNNSRRANGKSAITYNGQTEEAARKHNDHMIRTNCFSHQCPGEPGPFERLSNTGYRWSGAGEILAKGQTNCQEAVKGWLNSPGHRNIMLGNYKHFGCSSGQRYWTCVFANPK